MYQAELNGKLPQSVRDREDILTSNVFSFFKYADRRAYLSEFLELAQIELTPAELPSVTFTFWPCYEDGTEPDVIVQTPRHYLLVEAKYFSGVAEEEGIPAGQLVRECKTGLLEAENLSKEFKLLLITNDSTRPSRLLKTIPEKLQPCAIWTNWQSVARILVLELQKKGVSPPDYEFARDLLELLDYKHLRGFISFERLFVLPTPHQRNRLFFAAESASFRGDFIGTTRALSVLPAVPPPPASLFYAIDSPFTLPRIKRPLFTGHIFYRNPNHEQGT
jgi:hypothetical protein